MKTALPLVKPNIVDRVVNYIAPVHGARRLRARAVQAVAAGLMASGVGGYVGARTNRRATGGWITGGADADSAALSDLPKLRERSHDLLRNSPLSIGAINTVGQNVVGSGLAVLPRPDWRALGWTREQAVEWAAAVQREWRAWAESTDCDITRTQDFYGLQDLAFRSALESGDIFALLPLQRPGCGSPYRLCVQLIEADRVANPARGWLDGSRLPSGNHVFAGVEKDAGGAPVAYHILRRHPGAVARSGDWQTDRYEAFGAATGRRNVLHLFYRQRPDQTRGVPYLAPVIEALHQLGKYSDAELMAAVVSSMFTVFVKTPAGEGLNITQSAAMSMAGLAPAAAATSAPAADAKPLAMGAGVIVDLADGDDVSFADPKRPNTAFDGFCKAVLQQIGVALGLPLEVLTKHFESSYSAARAALLEAWKFYSVRRHWLARGFCQPVYEAWMDEAVALGRVAAPGYLASPFARRAYQNCEWIGDAPGSIDPLKEVQAARERINLEVSTLESETMQLTGQVWEEVHAQRVRERELQKRDGMDTVIAPEQTPSQPRELTPDEDEKQEEEQ